jgi:hypothetical protein
VVVRGTRIAVVCAVAAAGALAPSSAGALTFGTDLEQPANAAPMLCGNGVLNQFLMEFRIGPFGGSCTWTSVVVGSAAESLTAPATGTVTAVRVKMGATTGPMQVLVVRYLFSQSGNPGSPNLACCFVQAYGPVFTPAANAITTVPVNLPVTVEPTPPPSDLTDVAATDQLALSSLDPSVQVPLFATNAGQADLHVLSYAWYPAPTAPAVPAPSPNPIGGFADLTGFKLLMNADFTPAGSGGGGGPAPAPGGGGAPPPVLAPPIPALGLPATLPVRGNTATIPLRCLLAACNGTLTLQNAQLAGLARAGATTAKKPRLLGYGSARFALAAGAAGKVKVTLNASGRKLLSGRRTAKVWANVRFTSGGGAPKSTRVTLKR